MLLAGDLKVEMMMWRYRTGMGKEESEAMVREVREAWNP